MTQNTRTIRPLIVLAIGVLLSLAPLAVRADDASTLEQDTGVVEASDSLDDELLKELEETPPAKKPASRDAPARDERKEKDADPAAEPADTPELDEEFMRELEEGIEQSAEEADPLARVAQAMREVEGRLSRSKSDGQTRELQTKIVADLDAMIQEALKRAQRSQSQSASNSGKQGSQRSKVNQPQQQQQGAQGQHEQRPSPDSTERLGRDQVVRPDPGAVRDAMKHLWGHLPERDREMMLNASIEQFLPKYELLIEQYFRRLAEEQQQQ